MTFEKLAALTRGNAPALKIHTSLSAVDRGELTLDELLERGQGMFTTSFNTLAGAVK